MVSFPAYWIYIIKSLLTNPLDKLFLYRYVYCTLHLYYYLKLLINHYNQVLFHIMFHAPYIKLALSIKHPTIYEILPTVVNNKEINPSLF